MNTLVKDTFINVNTGTLIRNSDEIPQMYKEIMLNVYKYLALTNPNDDHKDWMELIKNSTSYDELKEKIIGCVSDECLACNMILLFHVHPRSFLLTTICTFCRTNPHKELHEGYNNFVLNNYLFEICMIMYKPFDLNMFGSWTVEYPGSKNKLNGGTLTSKSLYLSDECPNFSFQLFRNDIIKTVNKMIKSNSEESPTIFNKYSSNYDISKLINKSQKLENPDKTLDFLGNKLRKFIFI
jgi:hypothetical protein